MKTIGLLGGMSWESSVVYYRIINETVRQRLGGYHSARSLMLSVDFAEMEDLQQRGDWTSAGLRLAEAARALERGGADFLVLCTNTMHKLAEVIQGSVAIPLLHIADATAAEVRARGLEKVGLLGTRFTMEEDFYRGRLVDRHGLTVVVPDAPSRERIHRVIYDELVVGKVLGGSRAALVGAIATMMQQGAEGIILGCTEIGLLIRPGDVRVPVFDTTVVHALAAVDYALADE